MRLCLFSGACVKYFRSMSLHTCTRTQVRACTFAVRHIRRANTPETGHTSLHRTVVRYFHNRFRAGAFIAGNFAACWGVKWRSAIEYASTIRSLRSIVTRFYLRPAPTIRRCMPYSRFAGTAEFARRVARNSRFPLKCTFQNIGFRAFV